MSIIRTNDGKYYETSGVGTTAGAILAASGVCSAINLVQAPLNKYAVNKMSDISQSCERESLREGIDKAFDNLKLGTKGVTVVNIDKNTLIDNPFEKLPKWIQNQLNPIISVKEGKNSFYVFPTKEIYINKEKLGATAFHEMGHAANHNFSKFWGSILKCRQPLMSIVGLLGTVAICKRKKVEGEKPTGILDKTTTFIKDNIGKLTLLSFSPIVAEELMATYRGNKIAKKILSPELFKKVKTTNRFGALTYVVSAVVMALAGVAGSKVRDAIAKPKEFKLIHEGH